MGRKRPQREQQKGTPPEPRRDRLSSTNLALINAAGTGAWGIVTAVMHLSPVQAGVGAAAMAAATIGQAMKAKYEERREREKRDEE
jgi:hypothetical protein